MNCCLIAYYFVILTLAIKVATDTLNFTDLKLQFDKEPKQISVDVFAKNNKIYLHMFFLVCVFLKLTLQASLKMLLYILEGFVILIKKFEKHSKEKQKYLIARDYKPVKVKKKQFSNIKNTPEKRQENLNYRRPPFF